MKFSIVAAAIAVASFCSVAAKGQAYYTKASVAFETRHVTFEGGDPSEVAKGISLGYVKGFEFRPGGRLGMEAGARLAWAHKVDTERFWSHTTVRQDYLSVSLPVDLLFKFRLMEDKLVLAPFSGPNFKFNLIGRRKETVSGSKGDETHRFNYLDREALFPASIFQFGWRFGLNVCHGPFSVGYAFTYDFKPYIYANYSVGSHYCIGDARTASQTVSLGYTF